MEYIDKKELGSGLLRFWCPGCREKHTVPLSKWEWNKSLVQPTIKPEITFHLPYCETVILSGKIHYTKQCEHTLAGKTVNMEPVRED